MTEVERIKLLAKAEAIYTLVSELHTDICRLADKQGDLSEESCDICFKLIDLRDKLGGFSDDCK